ncbi:hypothetical protein FHETE_2032 [Fusarium heterosporum]|uniref:BZIP domain-containing protein n=1 Tax=Fusarium heterosporum TaxID=42747 RepID=A0A8H5TUU4_FUSHE|nr:hypothetical protein FHETE_2032 [Fusarium heterosporum]
MTNSKDDFITGIMNGLVPTCRSLCYIDLELLVSRVAKLIYKNIMGATQPIHVDSLVKDPVKRRGRPRKQASFEDERLMVRRARNRQAQYVYRMRQEAAQKDQTSRLKQLEDAVEGMSSPVEIFAKNILSLNVVKQHRELLAPLREMTATVLSLAKEVNSAGTYVPRIAVAGESGEISRRSLEAIVGGGAKSHPLTLSRSPPSQAQHVRVGNIVQSDTTDGNERQNIAKPPDQYSSGGPRMDHRLFGAERSIGFESDRLPLDSLAYKLVHSSLSTALSALTETQHPILPVSEECRIFGSILHAQRRRHLKGLFQWLLGPGAAYFFDCAKLSFMSDRVSESVHHHPTSGTPIDAEKLPFLSVMDIENKLVALGARIQDQEIIKLHIEDPNKSTQTMNQHLLSHLGVGNFDSYPIGQSMPAEMTFALLLYPSAFALMIMPDELVLITGAPGFIGSNIALDALEAGYKVRLAVRSEE